MLALRGVLSEAALPGWVGVLQAELELTVKEKGGSRAEVTLLMLEATDTVEMPDDRFSAGTGEVCLRLKSDSAGGKRGRGPGCGRLWEERVVMPSHW